MAMNNVAVGSIESAKSAGLRYVNDGEVGIRRSRQGRGFVYVGGKGKRIRDETTFRRIQGLVIPPAWTDVWICSSGKGHIQATGRDAKGRKQYCYHAEWRTVRDETKFEHMITFGEALPAIRARVEIELTLPGLPLEKVLATVVRLLDLTLIRVGNDEYARKNGSYGLTTLREKHVDVYGPRIRFHFRGKSGKEHSIEIEDKKLAKIVRRCQELPGHELFHYIDERGDARVVESGDVNDYLRTIGGRECTAKDFRTWAGTVLAASTLDACPRFTSERQAKQQLVVAIRTVAERLGNTPAVCRKSYIHPVVVDSFMNEKMRTRRKVGRVRGLHASEVQMLALLHRHARPAEAMRASA